MSKFIVSFRGRIIQDMPRLKQLDLLEISKEEKLEAGFRQSSDEDSGEDEFQDAVEDQGDNGHGKSGIKVELLN